MDNNFAKFLTEGWNTPTHILERRLILSLVKVLCTRYTHSLHPHRTHKVENRGVGSIKRWGGGAPASRGTLGIEKAPKKFFPEILATGGREKFSRRTIPKLHVFEQICLRNLEISKQKGHL